MALVPIRLTTLAFATLASSAMAVDYAKDIKPLLKERCYACHGALKQKAGLRLDTVALLKTGGDNGDATKHLLDRLTTTDKSDRMPPEGEGAMFTAEQVAKVREWLAAGAPGLTDEQPEADPRAHWAYQVPKNSRQNIDALHAAHLSTKQLKPQPTASHEVWLRRVYFDLTGLPPSDSSDMSDLSDAQLIDRLLASPQFGERWARHWLDLARYAETHGHDQDRVRPHEDSGREGNPSDERAGNSARCAAQRNSSKHSDADSNAEAPAGGSRRMPAASRVERDCAPYRVLLSAPRGESYYLARIAVSVQR